MNTVAASTSNRHFFSTLRLTATGGDTLDIAGGVTVTQGISTPTPVVLASAPPYSNLVCNAAARAGTFTGKIVVCERGHASNGDATGRVQKGFNVLQGGAAGMILYNPAIQQLNSDNHWLSVLHLEGPKTGTTAPAARLLAFLSSHTGVTATWTGGTATPVTGDVMTAFSSRGPLGDFIKPDVTAPGIQILAGSHTGSVRRERRSRPAGPAVPGDRRHVDVEPAQRGHLGPDQGSPPRLDTGSDQVGTDDLVGAERAQGGRRHARPIRSTAAPVRSAPTARRPRRSRSTSRPRSTWRRQRIR